MGRNTFVFCMLAVLTVAMGGCSEAPEDGPGGTGGHANNGGAGGTSATGGSGAGGTKASGGTTGSGGSATGGTSATGGASSGGTIGSGGTTRTGGTQGSGGSAGTGGSSHAGGTVGTGGTGSGGTVAGTGGTGPVTTIPGTGGRLGRGGATGSGGVIPDGGPDSGSDAGSTFTPCPSGAACKILPLGDSITEGFGSSGSDGGGPRNEGGYRIELFRQTVKNGKNITFVGNSSNGPTTVESKPFPKKHEGHGGWTISQIAGIADSTLSTNKPNIVLLKIGTNDVNGTGASGAPNGLKNLIDQITKDVPSALLVVSSIIPIKDDNQNQKVKTYNATIPTAVSAAAAAGKHVVFVDSYAAIVADGSWKTKYMGDNLHPNDAGYAVLGQTWYAAISALLPAGP